MSRVAIPLARSRRTFLLPSTARETDTLITTTSAIGKGKEGKEINMGVGQAARSEGGGEAEGEGGGGRMGEIQEDMVRGGEQSRLEVIVTIVVCCDCGVSKSKKKKQPNNKC